MRSRLRCRVQNMLILRDGSVAIVEGSAVSRGLVTILSNVVEMTEEYDLRQQMVIAELGPVSGSANLDPQEPDLTALVSGDKAKDNDQREREDIHLRRLPSRVRTRRW